MWPIFVIDEGKAERESRGEKVQSTCVYDSVRIRIYVCVVAFDSWCHDGSRESTWPMFASRILFLEYLTRRDGCDKNRLSSIEPGVEGARPLRLRPLPGLNARFTSQALDSVLRWDGAGAGAGAPFFEFVPWHKSDTITVRAAVATMACPTIRRHSPH